MSGHPLYLALVNISRGTCVLAERKIYIYDENGCIQTPQGHVHTRAHWFLASALPRPSLISLQ